MFLCKKLSYFLILSILISSTLHAEYLLFEQRDGTIVPVGPETPGADAAFLAIMKYQFPANTNPANGITPEERAALDDNEQAFIQKKVQEVNPNFAIMFIPSVLYELFCLHAYLEQPAPEWLHDLFRFIIEHEKLSDDAEITKQISKILASAPDDDLKPKHAVPADWPTDKSAPLRRTRIVELAKSLFTKPNRLEYMLNLFSPWIDNALGICLRFAQNFPEIFGEDYYMPRHWHEIGEGKDGFTNYYQKVARSAQCGLFVYKLINQRLQQLLQKLGLLIITTYHDNRELSYEKAHCFRQWLSRQMATKLGRPTKEVIPYPYIAAEKMAPDQFKTVAASQIMDIFPYPESVLGMLSNTYCILKWGFGGFHYSGCARLFKDSVYLEYNAHHNNAIVLYRGHEQGIKYADDRLYFASPKHRQLSFGATLFSGIFTDASAAPWNAGGANAFEYIISYNTAYALLINKTQYAKELAENKHLIFIPPYPSIVTLLWGHGEIFHPRMMSPRKESIHAICQREFPEEFYESNLSWPEFLEKFAKIFSEQVFFLKSRLEYDPARKKYRETEKMLRKQPDGSDQKSVGNHNADLEERLIEDERHIVEFIEHVQGKNA